MTNPEGKTRDMKKEGKSERSPREMYVGDKDAMMERETDRGEHWRASKGEKEKERNQEGRA